MSENATATRPAPPDLVVDHPAWAEALHAVRDALARPGAVVVLLGPVGSGKTLLLRTLRAEARAAGRDAVLLDRGDADNLPAQPAGASPLVLVDEADRIGPENLQALAGAGASVVLAALPVSAARLSAVPGADVVPLRLLRPEEAAAFVAARVARAGGPVELGSDAVAEIVAHGRGTPRLLVVLTTAAAFVAGQQGEARITAEHVLEAVSLRGDVADGEFVASPSTGDDAEAASDRNGEAGAVPNAASPLPEASNAQPGPRETAPEAEVVARDGGVPGPVPEERWVESAAPASAATPRPRRLARSWAVLACVVLAALLAAYAARVPYGDASPVTRAVLTLRRFVTASRASSVPNQPGEAAAVVPAPSESSVPAPAPLPPVPPKQLIDLAPDIVADPAPAASPVGLPHGVVPHVVLSYGLGDAAAERSAAAAERLLQAAGFTAGDPVPVPRRIPNSGVAYFFAEDEAGAAAVGRALGSGFGGVHEAPVAPDEPLPRPGTIEVRIASDRPEATEPAR
jgi:hypothetical protein